MKTTRIERIVGIAAAVVLLWQAVHWLSGLPPYLLPGAAAVAGALVAKAPLLAHHAAITLLEIVLGLGLGVAVGAAAALALALWPPVRRWLLPLLVISQAVPVFALAPILVLWLGYGVWPNIVIGTTIAFFPMVVNTAVGLSTAEPEMLDLVKTLRASRWQVFRTVALPGAMPLILTGVKLGIGMGLVLISIAEMVGAKSGLGYMMWNAWEILSVETMYVGLIVIAVLGIVFSQIGRASCRERV